MSSAAAETLFAHIVPREKFETDEAWKLRVYVKIKNHHGRDAIVLLSGDHATVVGESELKVAVDKAMRANADKVTFTLGDESMSFAKDPLINFLQKPHDFYLGYRIFAHDGKGRYTAGRVKLLGHKNKMVPN